MINTLIPGVLFVCVLIIGVIVAIIAMARFLANFGSNEGNAMILIAGILMIFVGCIAVDNISFTGPYFEELAQEKIYLSEGTIKLQDKYATVLTEWSPSTKEVVPKSELLYGSKDRPNFSEGDCVSLQGNELKIIKIQGCGYNN